MSQNESGTLYIVIQPKAMISDPYVSRLCNPCFNKSVVGLEVLY